MISPAPQVLSEVHFWGHLLEDGEPVAGELRLSLQGTCQQLLCFPSGAPLAGVEVGASGERSGGTAHFFEGQGGERESSGFSFNGRLTDAAGRAVLLLDPGTIEIWVTKFHSAPPWYSALSQRLDLRPGESATLRFNVVRADRLPREP